MSSSNPTRSLLPLLLLAVACGDPQPAFGTSATAASASATATASSASSAATTSASAKTQPTGKAKGPTAKERATLLGHLGEGRKLAQSKKWKEALVELDKGLAMEPKDGRVLAEIGWAAFNAGDLERAKKMNKQALANTKQPERRAAVLYNIGRVAEQEKDNATAKTVYAESLTLRYNAEVEKRYTGVGGEPGDVASPFSTCTKGSDSLKGLCDCLVASDVFADQAEGLTCEPEKVSDLGDPRLSVLSVKRDFPYQRVPFLVAQDGKKYRAVAALGGDFSPGAFGVNNTTALQGGKARKVKNRTVVTIRHLQENYDSNMAGLEVCHYEEKADTFCVLGEGDSATKCTLPLPVEVSTGCGPGAEVDPAELDPDTAELVEAMKKNAQPPDTVKASHTLDDNGKLVSKIESGDAKLVPKHAIGERQLVP